LAFNRLLLSKFSKKQKQAISQRAAGRCEYCQTPANYAPSPFPSEHVTPSSKGGLDDLTNIAFACNGCNWFKSNKTEAIDPQTGILLPLFNPRQQIWSDHFKWTEDQLKMVALTPIGNATIETLKLNREGLVNLRFALLAIGIHPPSIKKGN